jgi:uncharacterized protein (DUF1501 family)
MSNSTREDRRQFIKALGGLCAGGAAYALLPQLEMVGRALAADPGPNDYRALVCIFLFGGNDSFNMLIPHEQAEYNAYSTCRGGTYDATTNPTALGYARESLLQITDTSNKRWGLNPRSGGLKTLFDQRNLSFVANVGTLAVPVTKAEVKAKSKLLPGYLYSHNDQQRQWMTGTSYQAMSTGWGGRTSDKLRPLNTKFPALPPGISLSGNNAFQLGASTMPFSVSSSGPARMERFNQESEAGSKVRAKAMEDILARSYTPLMEDRFGLISETALELSLALRSALSTDGTLDTVFPADNSLAAQLRMIARLIKVSRSSVIGHKRQIFFASIGGFDTHQNQMADNGHGLLMQRVGDATLAFRDALKEIGALNEVMTFSMSDFGRTLNTNGNGTDHGWGGVQFVMGGSASAGGSLNGGQVFGTYPLLELDGPQAMGRGQMIPTTAVTQVGATLSRWMGVSSGDLQAIFPGLGNFNQAMLPFLA